MCVGVMIPCHNLEKYLGEALDSLVNQTRGDWIATIVLSNCSDNSEKIAISYADPRISILTADRPGCPAARNIATLDLLARGAKYIARLDGDDLWLPNHLELLAGYLDATPNIDLVSAYATNFSERGFGSDIRSACRPLDYLKQEPRNHPVQATIVARRAVYEQVGLFYENQLAGSDGVWCMRACVAGYLWACVPIVTYYYRRHDSQITSRLSTLQVQTHKTNCHKYLEQIAESKVWHLDMQVLDQAFVNWCKVNGKVFQTSNNALLQPPFVKDYKTRVKGVHVENGQVTVGKAKCAVGENWVRAYHDLLVKS